jgi:hypothetical protein
MCEEMDECELDLCRSASAPAVPSFNRWAMLGLVSARGGWRGGCAEMFGWEDDEWKEGVAGWRLVDALLDRLML